MTTVENGSEREAGSSLDPRATFPASELWDLLESSDRGVLITIRRDGRPQASNVGYVYDAETRVARIVAPAFRAKTKNLGRDPRAALHVSGAGGLLWLVADADVELSPVSAGVDDAVGQEIVGIYERFGLDRETTDRLIAESVVGRVVIRLSVSRVYGGNAHNATSRSE